MNLHSLIKSGESETLEFKEKFDERAVESAVAFANSKGGLSSRLKIGQCFLYRKLIIAN